MKNFMCIDIGTTKFKAVIVKNDKRYFEEFDSTQVEEQITALKDRYQVNRLFVTGSGARLIQDNRDYQLMNELECTAYLVKYFKRNSGLVVNIGTGTSFTLLEEAQYHHINGTGVGGGTFDGLGKRLLGIENSIELEQLARTGDYGSTNIIIKDIYPEGLGWLQDDVTVANFGKSGGTPADIALGIHSLVAEAITSMIRAMLFRTGINDVIISGGVANNQLIKDIMERYSHLFGFHCTYLEDASFGTCLGMIEVITAKALI